MDNELPYASYRHLRSNQAAKMLYASFRLIDCATLDAEHDVARARATNGDHLRPVDYPVATSAADGCPRAFSPLGHSSSFSQYIPHQHMIFFGGGPNGLGTFVGIHNRRASLGSKTNRLLK